MKRDIEKILEGIPNDNKEKMLYVARIKKYSNECGCSWGEKFLMASIVAVAFYLVVYYDWRNENFVHISLTVLLLIFIGGGIGKLTGIIIAKIKLRMLYKSLINKHKFKNL